MIRTKDELKRYIEYETRNFDHPILLKIPVDLYESQIIARYLILLRKTEYHINCGHKIRKIFYLWCKNYCRSNSRSNEKEFVINGKQDKKCSA